LFLRAKAAKPTALARLSRHNSVHPSVRPSVHMSVTRVDQSKTVQARITKFSPSAAWKTLGSGTLKLLHKFVRGHPERKRKMRAYRKNWRFLANKSLYLSNGAK